MVLTNRSGIVAQTASQNMVILDVEEGEYYSLNSVGARVWELCDGSRDADEVISIICEEFDESGEVIKTDVSELLEALVSENLLVETS